MININNICVVGAGNVGISCAVEFSLHKEFKVTLLSSKAKLLRNEFIMHDTDNNINYCSSNIVLTADYDEALKDADLVIITLPSFLVKDAIVKISEYSPKLILFTPGYGNKETYCERLIKKGCIISGFDRSPYICRLVDSNTVNSSKKKQIRVGCVNCINVKEISDFYEGLFGFKVIPLDNYLTVAFTPSNPVLHTSRLYSLFKNSKLDTKFNRMIKFYYEWDDESSEMMLNLDNELQAICRKIEESENINLSGVIPLSVHYESPTVQLMTKKIKSINSFKDIDAPLVQKNNYFYIDSESRYFREDFEFGLKILIDYASKYEVSTPNMCKVMNWYYRLIK